MTDAEDRHEQSFQSEETKYGREVDDTDDRPAGDFAPDDDAPAEQP
jgi:hypothetical protein